MSTSQVNTLNGWGNTRSWLPQEDFPDDHYPASSDTYWPFPPSPGDSFLTGESDLPLLVGLDSLQKEAGQEDNDLSQELVPAYPTSFQYVNDALFPNHSEDPSPPIYNTNSSPTAPPNSPCTPSLFQEELLP